MVSKLHPLPLTYKISSSSPKILVSLILTEVLPPPVVPVTFHIVGVLLSIVLL